MEAVSCLLMRCGASRMRTGLDVLHMSASNESRPLRVRLSCDTRWQPAGEPHDPRLKVWRTTSACGGDED